MIGPKTPQPSKADERQAYVRAKVRSFGLCEICGVRQATELHHRQYRSRGGRHEVANLLHVCGWGNHTGCHGKGHNPGAHENGWAVASGLNPEEVRVMYRGQWMRLTGDGGLLDGGDADG
jgi:hypothetical protein